MGRHGGGECVLHALRLGLKTRLLLLVEARAFRQPLLFQLLAVSAQLLAHLLQHRGGVLGLRVETAAGIAHRGFQRQPQTVLRGYCGGLRRHQRAGIMHGLRRLLAHLGQRGELIVHAIANGHLRGLGLRRNRLHGVAQYWRHALTGFTPAGGKALTQ